jgi:hypothetical protein
MSGSWNLDFGNETAEQVDLAAGYLQPGYYRMRLASNEEDLESGAMKLHFVVSHGLHAGKKLTESLNNPKMATDEKAAESAMKKARTWAVRLGAVPRTATGVAGANFDLAVGKEFVVEVEKRQFPGRDGVMREFTSAKYAGIFPLDHKDIPVATRVELGLPLLPGQQSPVPGKGAAQAAGPATAGQTTTTAAGAPQRNIADQAKALFGG